MNIVKSREEEGRKKKGTRKTCPFRPIDCGPQCALFNGGYNSCCIKLMAASIMKMAEFRKDFVGCSLMILNAGSTILPAVFEPGP